MPSSCTVSPQCDETVFECGIDLCTTNQDYCTNGRQCQANYPDGKTPQGYTCTDCSGNFVNDGLFKCILLKYCCFYNI